MLAAILVIAIPVVALTVLCDVPSRIRDFYYLKRYGSFGPLLHSLKRLNKN